MWRCKLFRIPLRRLPLSLRSPRVAQALRLTRVPLLVTKLSVVWIHSWLLQLRKKQRMGVHVDTIYTRNQYYGIRLVVMFDHRHDIPGQVVDESPVAELDLMRTSDAYPYSGGTWTCRWHLSVAHVGALSFCCCSCSGVLRGMQYCINHKCQDYD